MSIQLSLEPVSLPERHDAGRPGECRCPDRRWRSHHDRLLRVEADQDEVVELLELAVTWSELDYSGAQVVPPERWDDFALAHVESDAVQNMRLAVPGLQVADAEQRLGHVKHAPPPYRLRALPGRSTRSCSRLRPARGRA